VKCVFVVGHVDAPSLAAWRKRTASGPSDGTPSPIGHSGNSIEGHDFRLEEHGSFDEMGRVDLPTLTVPV